MAEVKKEVAPKVTTPKKEMVTVNLPLTRERQDDVFVCVNGESFLIQRGKSVEVPEYVKEVLDNAERMEMVAIERQKGLQ